MTSSPVLSSSDIEHFVSRGYVKVENCFDAAFAEDMIRKACERLYCSLDDSTSWPIGRMRAPLSAEYDTVNIAPRAWQAACELLGGADRIEAPYEWTDSFVINFGQDPDAHWTAPGPEILTHQKWHIDGDFFRHFLDSPEQGLLVIAVFSDIAEKGGGTHLACDSIDHVARFLAERTEGVLLGDIPADDIVGQCTDFIEASGSVGDVYFMHPFMAHSWSINESNTARFIINPPVTLREPMRFDRAEFTDHSAVERVVLRALGTTSFNFEPTTAREDVIPDRIKSESDEWEQRRMTHGSHDEAR